MSGIQLKARNDGLYVKHPKKGEDYINALKQALNEAGIGAFDESSFLDSLEKNRSMYLKVCSQLPPKYDAAVFFDVSQDDPADLIATLIPPKDGKELTKADILLQLDEEGYVSASPILKAIDDATDKQKTQSESIIFVVAHRCIPEINLTFASSNLEAMVTVKKPERCEVILAQDIRIALEKAGVVHGIKSEVIEEIASKNVECESVLVAVGTQSVNGKDGEIIYHFDAFKKNTGPQIDTHGRADFHNLGLFSSIKEGSELCEVTEPSKGIPGKNVFGGTVPAQPGKKPELPIGANTEPNPENPRVLLATIAGIPKLIDGKVIVDPVLDIKGDVGVKTGNIEFVGAVNVSGSVKDGFKISAKGDVVINDSCESVTIQSDGDVILKRGVRADENAHIKSGGDVIAKFLEGVEVEAAGSVIIQEYCYHCNIKAGDLIQVQGKRGYITGGRVSAKNGVITKRLGNPSATRTEILVDAVDDQKLLELSEEQQKQFEKFKSMLDETQDVLEKLDNAQSDQDKKEVEANKREYEAKKAEIIKRIKRIDPNFVENDTKTFKHVTVSEMVHPNVMIKIYDASHTTNDDLKALRFYYRKGEILMESYHSSGGE